MDGTLTKPNLDFGEMYRRCGVPLDQDLLAAVSAMPEAEALKAQSIIDEKRNGGRGPPYARTHAERSPVLAPGHSSDFGVSLQSTVL